MLWSTLTVVDRCCEQVMLGATTQDTLAAPPWDAPGWHAGRLENCLLATPGGGLQAEFRPAAPAYPDVHPGSGGDPLRRARASSPLRPLPGTPLCRDRRGPQVASRALPRPLW